MKPKHLCLFVSAIVVALSFPAAQAATLTWQGAGASGDTFSNAANWTGGVPTNGANDQLNFGSMPSVTAATINQDISPLSISRITIAVNSATNYTFTGADITLGTGTGVNGIFIGNTPIPPATIAPTQLHTVANNLILPGISTFQSTGSNGANLVLSGIISGAGGIQKSGQNSVTITGTANTFTNSVSVSGGTVNTTTFGSVGGVSSGLGAPTTTLAGTIKLGSAAVLGTLVHTGAAESSNRDFDLAGSTGGGTISHTGAGTLSLIGGISSSVLGTKLLTLNAGTATNAIDASGVIKDGVGVVNLAKSGLGTVTLSGANTYTGTSKINGGTASVTSIAGNLGTSTTKIQIGNAGTTGTLLYTGVASEVTTRGIDLTGATGGATLTTTAASSLTIGGVNNAIAGNKTVTFSPTDAAGSITVNGAITEGTTLDPATSLGTVTLVKSGAGTLTLNGTNTYTGVTTITGGVLALSSTGSISSARVSVGGAAVANQGTFDVSAKTTPYLVPELVGSGDVKGDVEVTTLKIGNSAATGANAVGQITFSNNLTVIGVSEFQSGSNALNTTIQGDYGVVTGTLTLGGDFTPIVFNTLTAGTKYTLFSYGTLVGGFNGITDETDFVAANGNTYNINYDDTTPGANGGPATGTFVTLNVVSVIPEPSTLLLGALGMLSVLRRRR